PSLEDSHPTPQYNFRKRRKINYNENDNERDQFETNSQHIQPIFTTPNLPTILLMMNLLSLFRGSNAANITQSIKCTQSGVELYLPTRTPYEICVENYCIHMKNPKANETIPLPPDIKLHEHLVQWKISTSQSTIETMCQAGSFCQSIQCTICMINALNPECWPTSAIVTVAVSAYIVTLMCYLFSYILMAFLHPIKLLSKVLGVILNCCTLTYSYLPTRKDKPIPKRSQQKRRLAEIIAVSLTISSLIMKSSQPNVPIKIGAFTITLSSIGIPPIPLLNTFFITDGKNTSVWRTDTLPPLQCSTHSQARAMKCPVFDQCKCVPAENHINCNCRTLSVKAIFDDIRSKLPVIFPSLTFQQYFQSQVQAVISREVTSEIIMNFKDTFVSNILVKPTMISSNYYTEYFKHFTSLHKSPAIQGVEQTITSTVHRIHDQLIVATTLKKAWEDNLQDVGASRSIDYQFSMMNRLLRNTITARETLLRLTTEFLLLDSINQLRHKYSKSSSSISAIKSESVARSAERQLIQYGKEIDEMEWHIQQVEKRFEIERTFFKEVKNKISAMENQIDDLRNSSRPSENQEMQEDNDGSNTQEKQAQGLTDEEYLLKSHTRNYHERKQ
ncbi:hypothetical protein OSTOST_00683, partial [Ostertagia ostertagi]